MDAEGARGEVCVLPVKVVESSEEQGVAGVSGRIGTMAAKSASMNHPTLSPTYLSIKST